MPDPVDTSPESAFALANVTVAAPAGEQKPMSVRLDLSHLGTVEISVDQSLNNPELKVSTDRKETLDVLLSDQGSLRSLLQQGGIDNPGSAVQFAMLSQDADRQSSSHQHNSNRRQNDERRAGGESSRLPPIALSAASTTASVSAGAGSVDITA